MHGPLLTLKQSNSQAVLSWQPGTLASMDSQALKGLCLSFLTCSQPLSSLITTCPTTTLRDPSTDPPPDPFRPSPRPHLTLSG